MLEFLRRSATSFFAWIILGVLALVFALSFGMPSDAITLGSKPLVSVYGEDIDPSDYREQYALIEGFFGAPKDEQAAQTMGFKQEVLESAIERTLLAHEAEQLGLAATKGQVEDLVLKGEILVLGQAMNWLGDLGFNYDYFKNLLRNLQVSEQSYMETQREELLARTLRDLVASSVAISEQELRQAYAAEANKLDLRFVRFEPDDYADLVDPDPEQLASYIEDHREALLAELAEAGTRFKQLPKQTRVYVIEIPKSQPQAQQAIERAAKAVAQGRNFRSVARESSAHTSSTRGGDLGWVSAPTGVDPAVAAALDALEPGAVSEVVEGEEAFYLVRNAGVREGDLAQDDALTELAEEAFRRERGRELAQRAAQEALAAVTSGKPLSEVFASPGDSASPDRPTLRETGSFAKGSALVPGLGPASDLIEAAWSADPETPLLDQVFEVGDAYILAGLESKEEASDEGFEQARDQLYDRLLQRKGNAVMARWAHRMCLEAKGTGDITANENRIAAVIVYEQDLGFKPYEVCERVGQRGGLAQMAAFR